MVAKAAKFVVNATKMGVKSALNGSKLSTNSSTSLVEKPVGGHPWKAQRRDFKGNRISFLSWKPLAIGARDRLRVRKEVLLAGENESKRKGHKCDRISAEKRAKTAELKKKMPEMLLKYKDSRKTSSID
ncbi:hypothetical protein AMTRI_Chr07g79000 [Amborella trichopoda]